MTPFVASEVKALFFDVFGTLVDWRSSIAREASAVIEPLGLEVLAKFTTPGAVVLTVTLLGVVPATNVGRLDPM